MNVEEMAQKIVWLGHDGFRIEGTKTVYIDPYEIAGGPPADLILVSHEHYDHCSPTDIGKIKKPETVIVTDKISARKLQGNIRVVAPGETIAVEGVTVEAVPAYNIGKKFHPKDKGWLGFILSMDGVRIYHAGDTDLIPEMKTIRADIALLPVSGTYVMTAAEAVEAAKAINPEIAIPMHYGAIVGGEDDARAFKAGLEGTCRVEILKAS